MGKTVVPQLQSHDGNVSIKTYGYNSKTESISQDTKTKIFDYSEDINTALEQQNYNYNEDTKEAELVDVLHEGAIQSYFDGTHIFDDVSGESTENIEQTKPSQPIDDSQPENGEQTAPNSVETIPVKEDGAKEPTSQEETKEPEKQDDSKPQNNSEEESKESDKRDDSPKDNSEPSKDSGVSSTGSGSSTKDNTPTPKKDKTTSTDSESTSKDSESTEKGSGGLLGTIFHTGTSGGSKTSLPANWESPYKQSNVDNQKKVYSYLKNMGLNDAAVAGIMGNINHESRFSPSAVNKRDSNGYASRGLVQWNDKYYKQSNYGTTVESQMSYLEKTLKSKTSLWESLKSVPNTEEGARQAAKLFAQKYEICNSGSWNQRKNEAANFFKSF